MTTASQTAARAGLYRLLALAFAYPERVFLDAARSGEYQEALASCLAACGGRAQCLPELPARGEDLEAAYLQLFELGGEGGAACALREGSHVTFRIEERIHDAAGGAPTLLEDLLRFYRFFGLKLSQDPSRKLPPDHIACELEMLSHLCCLESDPGQPGEVVRGCRAAQKDFLGRHVARWWPHVVRKLRDAHRTEIPHRFYVALAELSLASITMHSNELCAAC